MSSFSFKNVVFYIQVLIKLICVRNFGKALYIIYIKLLKSLFKENFKKLSTKFYDSYKSLINFQKHSNIKDKIKTNVHFDNTFTVNE